ncbi:dipeptidase PepV [Secundilactobacillus paracollinoides]|uniref:Dipeptidase PepV n=1 Tax=Secundilactobacillus paracollinoides TaxID=240427 RepID=A0A1B2J1N2_9LACO|nr:dipeptidase PepV [Secundilactobacillus paracollinoides]ANZ62244.1 dipeptidase PepV [Secundilactobacillus paracollinoides]ANZ68193.1 dipeptidase PepV [Secundilactobacillus paracollinoides]
MTIDWKQAAADHRDAYLSDLKDLIAIQSVRDDSQKTADAPLGPGPATALQAFLKLAERDGFETTNLDNLAGFVEVGSGDETVAILAHVDVMPAGEGWDTDPFTLTLKDGNAYGRGTSDDKGPALACYYGLKILKEQGVKLNKKIRFILGTDEESGWAGMTHYFKTHPEPTMGFSPDAEFPIINGEKGNVSFTLTMAGENDGDYTLTSFNAGLRENMVPRDAHAVVETSDNEVLVSDFTSFLDNQPVTGDVTTDGDGVHLHVIGKAAHGMEPKNGINAGTYLARFLRQYGFGADAKAFLNLLGDQLHDDSRVTKLGLAYTDDIMGELTMNVGVMAFDAEKGGHIVLNFRYPKGIGSDDIQATFAEVAKLNHFELEKGREMVPHYVSPDDPIVTTLMSTYQELTGDTAAEPEVVGGGTYGRLMKRGVAFGALFAHTPDTMHQVNEFQPVDDLLTAMAIYGRSIEALSNELAD